MRRGDLLFFYPVSYIDSVIVKYSGVYCHCGLYLESNMMISARWQKGIDFDLLSDYKKPFDLYRIKNITDDEIVKMCQFAVSLRGKRYDKRQVLSVPFFRIFSHPNHYFCSEFLAVLLIFIGYIPNKHPENISPTDLANQDFLIRI